MRVLARSFCLVLVILILACATVAQAKTSLRRVSKISAASLKITPQVLRGKIIFLRGDDVWMFDPETRRERMIFNNPFWEGPWAPFYRELTFSPDLKKVVFTHEPKDSNIRKFTGNELYVMNVDRSGKERLTNTESKDYAIDPRFSPDGKQVLYTRHSGYRMGGPGFTGMEIRIVNIDGSNDHRVIGDIDDLSQSFFGAFWSRNEKRLLFTHYIGNIDYDGENTKQELKTCALDGSDVKAFDGNYSGYLIPDVSPDARWRAVVEAFSPVFNQYLVLKLHSSQNKFVRGLVFNEDLVCSLTPQWTPDSKRVIFEAAQIHTQVDSEGRANKIRQAGIWGIGADGRDLHRLTTDAILIAVL